MPLKKVKLNRLPVGNHSKYGREMGTYGKGGFGGGDEDQHKKKGAVVIKQDTDTSRKNKRAIKTREA